jgi:HAMP domain-containing protein
MNIFRYCGALFALYVILLAAVCITYTHKVIGPLNPINRQIDALIAGDYQHRLTLRKKDLPLIKEQAEKLNALAATLDKQ